MFLYFCSKLAALAQLADLTLPWIIYQILQRNKSRVSLSPSPLYPPRNLLCYSLTWGNLKIHHEQPELSKTLWRGPGEGPTIYSLKLSGVLLTGWLCLLGPYSYSLIFYHCSIEKQADFQLDNLHNLAGTRDEDKFSFTQSPRHLPRQAPYIWSQAARILIRTWMGETRVAFFSLSLNLSLYKPHTLDCQSKP